jgi:hypothetical protein
MMRTRSRLIASWLIASIAGATMLASSAEADWWWHGKYGNDTGGYIPWSPEIRYIYRDIAAQHCAQYNKISHITSVHAWYGDYVGFTCDFPRHYDPVKAWYYGFN